MKLNLKKITPDDKEDLIKTVVFGGVIITLVMVWIEYVLEPIQNSLDNYNIQDQKDPIIQLAVIGFIGLSALFMFWIVSRSIEFGILRLIYTLRKSGKERKEL